MMYSIGEFSKMAKISVKTLRFYDEIDLLKPTRVDNFTNYRYYDTVQLIDLQKIIAMKQAGLAIDDIKTVLHGGDTIALLQKTKTELAKRSKTLTENIARLNLLIKNKGEIHMNYQATIKEVPGYIVFYKQGVVKNYSEIGRFIVDAGEECRAANPDLKCIKPDYCYASYLADEYQDHDIKLEYAQAVERAGKPTESIKFKEITPTKAVSVYHHGPYANIGEAYAFAMNWLKENNLTPSEHAREVYIDGPWNKDNESGYLTEIQIPVK